MTAADFVPVVPELSRNAGTAESKAGRAVPVVPAVPDEKRVGGQIVRIVAALDRARTPEPTPAPAADTLRAHLLELAADEGIKPTVISELDDDDLLAAEGLSDAGLLEWLRLCDDARVMARGLVPWRWNGERAVICAGCGAVALWPGAPAAVLACPWCWHRRRGIEPARPSVTCGTCEHYITDELNPTGGAGRCAQSVAGPHWPQARIRCGRWRPTGAPIFAPEKKP